MVAEVRTERTAKDYGKVQEAPGRKVAPRSAPSGAAPWLAALASAPQAESSRNQIRCAVVWVCMVWLWIGMDLYGLV